MSASARVSDSPGVSLPKWQIALAIGAPVALIGLGVWYYRSSRKVTSSSSKEQKKPDPVQKKKASSQGNLQKATDPVPSSQEAKLSQVNETQEDDPFKLAQSYKNKGNKQFKEGRYADAIKSYQQVTMPFPATCNSMLTLSSLAGH